MILKRGSPFLIRMIPIKDGVPVQVSDAVLRLENEDGQFVEYPAKSDGIYLVCVLPDLGCGVWKACFRFENYVTEQVRFVVTD